MNTEPHVWSCEEEDEKDVLHYTGCGLDDVYLASGYQRETTPLGEGVRIRDLDSLHLQIGLHLIRNRKSLSGREIRFLRHQMDLTQSELAKFFGCNVQQVARYEKDQSQIPGPADRILRILFDEYADKIGSVRELLESLDAVDDGAQKMVFEDIDGKWRHAA